MYYRNRVCVPNDDELKKSILEEANMASFSMHPGSTEIYQDLKTSYLWSGMKRCIGICDQVYGVSESEGRNQVPSGLLKPIKIPEWKWDRITMDFVVGLSLTGRKHDTV